MRALEMTAAIIAVLLIIACSQPAGTPPTPATSPLAVAVIDAGVAPSDATPRIVYGIVYPPDAAAPLPESVTRPDAAPAPAAVQARLHACGEVPKRSARSDRPDHRGPLTPRDFLGKSEAAIRARYGAPWCGTHAVKQWAFPPYCSDWRQVVTVWFRAGKASDAVARTHYTGEYCVNDM